MIKIENVDVHGWVAAIRGARNPMNSWAKTDSEWDGYGEADGFSIGDNDRRLLQNLANAGPDHGKFLRMITVSLDITAPLYWWKVYAFFIFATQIVESFFDTFSVFFLADDIWKLRYFATSVIV